MVDQLNAELKEERSEHSLLRQTSHTNLTDNEDSGDDDTNNTIQPKNKRVKMTAYPKGQDRNEAVRVCKFLLVYCPITIMKIFLSNFFFYAINSPK